MKMRLGLLLYNGCNYHWVYMPQRVPNMKKSSPAKRPAVKPKSSSQKISTEAAKPKDFAELISLHEIKELIEFVAEKEFDDFELERGDFRLCLRKGGSKTTPDSPGHILHQMMPQPVVSSIIPPTVTPTPLIPPPAIPAPAEAVPVEETLHIITSPIVGTFYRASSPTVDPFVKIGDLIEANQTLCIIEAMKLMNEIQSDVSGTVAKILIENGQPVEYGQPLFGIKV